MSSTMRLYRDRFNSHGLMSGIDEPVRWWVAILVAVAFIILMQGARYLQNYQALKSICKLQPAAMTCPVKMHDVLAI